MKKLILTLALASLASLGMAQQVTVERQILGSGSPELIGAEGATKWDHNIYHAPQYMPGYPTAASLWPRVVDVQCTQDGTVLKCDGYHWLPDLGRGEYLMIRPMIKVDEKPQVVTKTVTVPVIVYKEVPAKKKGE